LKRPNCGSPKSAQPFSDSASRTIVRNPVRCFGQPSARASGSHIAMTSGVRTSDGFSSATYSRSASKLSRRPHSDDAGDQTVGFSRPRAMLVCASPEATMLGSTKTCRPPASMPARLNSSSSGFSSGSFSGE
jgi:hypothetical protein